MRCIFGVSGDTPFKSANLAGGRLSQGAEEGKTVLGDSSQMTVAHKGRRYQSVVVWNGVLKAWQPNYTLVLPNLR